MFSNNSSNDIQSQQNNVGRDALKVSITIIVSMFVSMFVAGMLILGVLPNNAWADDLEDAAAEVEEAQATYDSAVAKQEELQTQLDTLSTQIADLEANLPAQQEAASDVILNLYKSGGEYDSLIDLFLSSDSFSEIISALQYYEYLAEYRTEILATAKASKEQLEASYAETETAKAEQDAAVEEAEDAKKKAQTAYAKAQTASSSKTTTTTLASDSWNTGYMTLSQFKYRGVVYDNGYRYTYYSESVLPGGGLNIPGRHHSNGLVVDGDGYICVASSDLSRGTVVPTPLGDGKVYDSGCASGTIDIYIA